MFARRLEEANILDTYSSAKQRLLLFDYDGTLTPIVENPAAAILSLEALQSIQQLAMDPWNEVWIISGRSSSFLEEIFGQLIQIGLVAEHGSFFRAPGATSWTDLTANVDMRWQDEVFRVFQRYTDITPGSRIEKKRAALVWHFRQASQDYATLQAAECKKDLLSKFGPLSTLEFIDGKCVLEARLKGSNKGQMAQRLVDRNWVACGKPPDFVICFGDDATDEGNQEACYVGLRPADSVADMFRALRTSGLPLSTVYNVFVGESQKVTDADWIVSDPTEVIATIMSLNNCDKINEREDVGQDVRKKRNSKVYLVPRSYLLGSSP